ncbi:hypothetical protein BC826DRAFT_602619 [Russula brevipes]|nr:hypothetical protein BC826DRAFT_602619 [Russula brevipes]
MFKSYRPPLPSRFQGPFPFNMISLALLPVLFPTFICLALIRLPISSRQPRSRIKLLESEDASTAQRLVHVIGQLERHVEDIVDDSAAPHPSQEGTKASKKSPQVTPAQRKMAAVLNSLPQLKKERAYIPNMRNSHATIIARDVENFEFRKIGEGVLRHWADGAFVL